MSAEQRVAARREKLLEAALEVFTAQGFHGTKVRDICRAAGLTERYFYESFAGGKEELLVALAERIVTDLVTDTAPGIVAAADDVDAAVDVISRAAVQSLTDDPRKARILFVEVVGVSPAIETQRRVVIGALSDVVRNGVAAAFGDWLRESTEVELISRALIGAAQELLIAYVRGELELDQEGLIEQVGRLFVQAGTVVQALAKQGDKTS